MSHRNDRNGLKSRGSESIDAQDFEIVGQQSLQSMAPKGDETKEGAKEPSIAKEYQKFVDKIKDEIRPFKKELQNDENVLQKLRSHLIEESKSKPKTGKNDPKPINNENPGENEDDKNLNQHDLEYELHSLKYELIKKDDQIDKLKNRIKSFSNALKNCSENPDSEACKAQLSLLKKELGSTDNMLFEDDEPTNTTDTNKKPIQLNLDKFTGSMFLQVYLGSSFHVINAVLLVILLSIYYSREPFNEKQYISTLTVLAYFMTTMVYGYVTSKTLLNHATFQTNDPMKQLIKHVIMFLACLTSCVILVCFVALRYEDATTFIMNMIYLMFCCLAINLPLTFMSTKFTENGAKKQWKPIKKPMPEKPHSLKKSD